MFINSISKNSGLYVNKSRSNQQIQKQQLLKTNANNTVSFKGGVNTEVLKNQLRIYLTQDIWAEKLNVKMPESPLEKEVLLEILNNRLKLDRFVRLSNEKLKIKTLISRINRLLEQDPSNPELPELTKKLENKGNLETVFKNIDKNIEFESKKNKPALDYFEKISEKEEEYLNKHLVKTSAMDKFWHKIKKQDINAEKKYSVKELIDIVSNGNIENTSVASTNVVKLSKKQILAKIEKDYEQLLRETIDVYSGQTNHNAEARKLRKDALTKNISLMGGDKNLQKIVTKVFEKVENKFSYKADRMINVDIYPIGEIWSDMNKVEAEIKKLQKEIENIKNQLSKQSDSIELKKQLFAKEKSLNEHKKEWLKGVKLSIKYEAINRQRMINADRLPEYDFLTGENKTLKRHKEVFKILNNNNDTIPEELWSKFLVNV